LVPFGFYLASISPEPARWDTAEMQTVPYILGIAHPTGFPLYVLTGWLWSHALPIGTVAFRMNLFSAVALAASCWLLYRTARAVECSPLAALCGALLFAFGRAAWWNAQRADVHSLAVLCGALTIYALVRWHREGGLPLLGLAAAGIGLGLAVHPVALWLVPGFIALVIFDYRRHEVDARMLALCAAGVALCLCSYAYLPLRSQYVSAHQIDPVAALPGAGSFLYDYLHPASAAGFLREVTGSDFGAGTSALAAAFQWWEYGWYALRWFAMVPHQCGVLALPLALAGFAGLARRDWELAAALALLGLGALPFSYAFTIESEPDRYRLLSMWLVGLLVAAAPQALGNLRFARIYREGALVFAAAAALGALSLNADSLRERTSPERRPFIRDVAAAVPPGSAVVAVWSDATTLGYAAYVDGSFAGRIVVSAHPEEVADWPPATARSRPIYLMSTQPVSLEKSTLLRVLPGVPDRFLYRYLPPPEQAPLKGSEAGSR
jgi:hypothetical protein